jgi:NAD(P)-dependent dehydrogenase (short-subunit alcohol dehydrogenase family)
MSKHVIQGALRGLGVNKIDILVNNAAVGPPPLPATDFGAEEYDLTMNINVRAPMLLVKELLPVLSGKNSRIINMCVKKGQSFKTGPSRSASSSSSSCGRARI